MSQCRFYFPSQTFFLFLEGDQEIVCITLNLALVSGKRYSSAEQNLRTELCGSQKPSNPLRAVQIVCMHREFAW